MVRAAKVIGLLSLLTACASVAKEVTVSEKRVAQKQSITFLHPTDAPAVLDVRFTSGGKDRGHQEVLLKKDGVYNQKNVKIGSYPKDFEAARAAYEKLLDRLVDDLAEAKKISPGG